MYIKCFHAMNFSQCKFLLLFFHSKFWSMFSSDFSNCFRLLVPVFDAGLCLLLKQALSLAETEGCWIEKSGTSLDMCFVSRYILSSLKSFRIKHFYCSFHNIFCVLCITYFYIYTVEYLLEILTKSS